MQRLAGFIICLHMVLGKSVKPKRVSYPQDVFLTPRIYSSCSEAWDSGFNESGIYALRLPFSAGRALSWAFVVCNNSPTHAATVILLRSSGKEPFNRSWIEYVSGFGEPKSDYFIGLENIFNLTAQGNTSLRIRVEDIYGNAKSIYYERFKLSGRPDYALGLSKGEGSLPDDLWFHDGSPFAARGKEDSRPAAEPGARSCAQLLQVGWWFRRSGDCALALLTGSLHPSRLLCRSRRPVADCDGLYWEDWTGFQSLKAVTMEVVQEKATSQAIL